MIVKFKAKTLYIIRMGAIRLNKFGHVTFSLKIPNGETYRVSMSKVELEYLLAALELKEKKGKIQ